MSEQIATYTFLPWLRQGLASTIRREDNLGTGAGQGERASVFISLKVNGEASFVSRTVQIAGPGDVIGISPRAVVRTEPRNWVTDFEPNYLSFVEFYDEDFPWRFTPARAVERDNAGNPVSSPQQTRLRPWIVVVALEEGEFEQVESPSGLLPTIRLAETANMESILPPAAQSWAWAHVHVSRDITAGSTHTPEQSVNALEAITRQNPDHALSRLICPRKLKASTSYHAFLIPAFEIGRLAGLGKPTEGMDSLAPSWGAGQDEYPVYFRWFFRTGERGDFEYLVNLLQPREADERVGIRDMDMQAPNFGIAGMSSGRGDLPVMGLEGALKSPQTQPKPQVWAPADSADYPAFLNQLADMVNLQENLLTAESVGHPDPIVSPPLYGRWHALQSRLRVGEPGWVNELNQDPRLRVSAGFGTKVIQKGQEDYMRRAWQQLGDVLSANQKIRQVQMSIAASMRVFSRHFASLPPDQQIALTQQVHQRVLGAPTTVSHQIKAGLLPEAAVQPAFRRVVRPRGAIARRAFPNSAAQPTDILMRLNVGRTTAAFPKRIPQKQISLSRLASRLPDNRLHENNLTTSIGSRLRSRPDFRLSLQRQPREPDEPGDPRIPREPREPSDPREPRDPGSPIPQDPDSDEAARFRTAMLDLHARFEMILPPPEPKPPVDLSAISSALTSALNPRVAILRRTLSVIHTGSSFGNSRSNVTIAPVMGHPVFPDPMYKPLRDISSELLIPNLHLVPNNTITLLETNPKFIEAYMVGLNHEMARELLWREYPTDQRGSYFRQFWDAGEVASRDVNANPRTLEAALRDIQPLHLWQPHSALGSHENRSLPTGREPDDKKLVLMIRGDLLKKYPTAVIFAQQAKWEAEVHPFTGALLRWVRVLDDGDPAVTIKAPIFKAQIEPDIHFLGFDLTVSKAKGSPTPPGGASGVVDAGWFFVIQERPGEPRFGLDIVDSQSPLPTLQEWNDLTWNHLGNPDELPYIDLNAAPALQNVTSADSHIRWASNAADMAYILYQDPVMVAVHADNMLE